MYNPISVARKIYLSTVGIDSIVSSCHGDQHERIRHWFHALFDECGKEPHLWAEEANSLAPPPHAALQPAGCGMASHSSTLGFFMQVSQHGCLGHSSVYCISGSHKGVQLGWGLGCWQATAPAPLARPGGSLRWPVGTSAVILDHWVRFQWSDCGDVGPPPVVESLPPYATGWR